MKRQLAQCFEGQLCDKPFNYTGMLSSTIDKQQVLEILTEQRVSLPG
jgi:hypothetical protein